MTADKSFSPRAHTVGEQINGKSRHGEENEKYKQVDVIHQLEIDGNPGNYTESDEINADDEDRQ